MRLRFTKMHGIGNDFVMIDAITQKVRINSEIAKIIADRQFGVGCDQVLVVEPPESPQAEFRYRIFNSDGSEVENCGNGARCFAIFVRQKRLTVSKTIRVETAGGLLQLSVNEYNTVTVDMGPPIFDPAQIPYSAETQLPVYSLHANNQHIEIGAVSMGNPHAITLVDDVDSYPVETMGPAIEAHIDFPNKVNAGFMQVLARNEIKLRVYERGTGETLACGTGACAAVVSGILRGLLDQYVTVRLPGGTIKIEWKGSTHPVMMSGPAVAVFSGHIKI